MDKKYYKIADLEKSPHYYGSGSIGRDVTLSTPCVSIHKVAGIYVEPLDNDHGYNMRMVRVFDPSGTLLFEMTLHAAAHLETGD
jgi:hypothetical protein